MIDGQWQEAQLRALPVERGVRQRGVCSALFAALLPDAWSPAAAAA
ncbi:MAG: hypothetical protein RIC56_12515 [Pseudomonadales bacterium]